jgi:ribose 5-phosphate isomerase A
MDIYLDGCDQFDQNLNALKSGGGIHSMEKLLAAMAEEFILVGDESKFTSTFSKKFPLAIEVFPEAMSYVEARLLRLYQQGRVTRRKQGDSENFFRTTHGNDLLDLWFEKWPALSEINPALKSIPGVVETSLFYGMAKKAIVAGTGGVKMMLRP